MILECPQCEARFRVPSDALGARGRRVRCGACGHVWTAYADDAGDPSGALDDAQAEMRDDRTESDFDSGVGEPASRDENEDEEPDEQEALRQEVAATIGRLREAPAYAAANVPALPRRNPPWIMLGWIAWALFVGALIAVTLLYRTELQAAWPPSQMLYAKLGFAEAPAPPPEPAPDEALEVQIGATPQWQEIQGGWRMTVDGVVRNLSDRRMSLPQLVLELMNAEGAVLETVRVELGQDSLDSRARLEFRQAIEPAPAETSGISYRWER